MSLIVKLLPFALCYVSMLIFFSFLTRKMISLMAPAEEKNNFSIAIFAMLNAIMAVVSIPAFFLFVDRTLSQLTKNNYFVMLMILFVAQFALSLFALVSYKNEARYVVKHEAHQIFAVLLLIIILSAVMINVVSATMF